MVTSLLGQAARWVAAQRSIASAMTGASSRAPSMKVDRRPDWKRMPATYKPATGVIPCWWRMSPLASSTATCSPGGAHHCLDAAGTVVQEDQAPPKPDSGVVGHDRPEGLLVGPALETPGPPH